MAPIVKDSRTCVSCKEQDGKYKCAKCFQYTCSLDCNRKHNENHPEPEQSLISQASSVTLDDEGEDPDELKKLFKQYPNLRAQLRSIAAATDPPPVQDTEMNKNGRMSNGRPRTNKSWTKDIGYENGIKAMRRMMNGPGSEGLKEYCEWVKMDKARVAEENEARLRREAAQRDAQAIEKLLREERSKAE